MYEITYVYIVVGKGIHVKIFLPTNFFCKGTVRRGKYCLKLISESSRKAKNFLITVQIVGQDFGSFQCEFFFQFTYDFRRFCFSDFIIKDITFIVRKGLLNNFCLKENFLMNVLLLHDIKLSTEPILVS